MARTRWNREGGPLSLPIVEPDEHARMPSLVIPLALVGAAAAVFSILAIAPLRNGMQWVSLPQAAGLGALGGGLLGLILRRWQKLHAPMASRDVVVFRVGIATVVTGTAIGHALGVVTWGFFAVWPFALGGALASLAFIPACLTVLDAGRRAARARMGSIVAASDRRTIWGTALSVIAVTSLVGVPTIAAGCAAGRLSLPQQVSLILGVAVACALGGVWLESRDAAGSDKLRRGMGAGLKEASPTAQHATDFVDVGIGSDHWGRLAGSATYRASEREEIALHGDLESALFALDEAKRRRTRTQALAALSMVASLTMAFASDVREVGAEGCFRRVRDDVGCSCVGKDRFPPQWPD